MRIRIIKLPQSEAPEQICAQWVGLELKVAPNFPHRAWFRSFEIISGHERRDFGYAVEGIAAMKVLEARSPEAAAWWRRNAPKYTQSGGLLIFAAEACEEIGWRRVTTRIRHFFTRQLSEYQDAEKGDPVSQFKLGMIYYHGEGVEQDYAQAFRWVRQSAEQGYDEAQIILAEMYLWGEGVAEDRMEGIRWLRKAAEQGHLHAQTVLAWIYYHGDGVKQDYGEALVWFQKTAEQGVIESQLFLGMMCHGGFGTEQNYSKAFDWYTKAANQGNAKAQAYLGVMYEKGHGVEKDFAEAYKRLSFSDAQGFKMAAVYRKIIVQKATAKEIAEGERRLGDLIAQLRAGAERGNADGQLNLGRMFDAGQGVAKDRVEAYKWFRLAAVQGNWEAYEICSEMGRFLTPDQIAEGKDRAAAFSPMVETP